MATRRQMDLLTAVEQIVEKAQGSGLSSEFYRKAARPIKYVAEKMDLTREQSVMMALFIENSDDTCIKISDLGVVLGCRTTRIIKYMAEIDVLEKRELVRCSRKDRCYTYRVPIEVVEAFKNNEKYVPKDCSGLTCMELFSELENIFKLRSDGELTYGAMVEKIHYMFSCNSHLLYVQKVKSYDFYDGDEMMLVLFSHLFVNNNDDNVRIFDLDFLLEKREWMLVKRSLSCGDYPLLEEKLIEYNHDGGFVNRESFRMTDKAKRELFGELNLASMDQRNKRGDMIKTEEIVPKKLFYGNKVGAQISELGGLLGEVHYEEVRARMKATGFRCCFTCLFYGQPGTGKTETVLQLARQTGRDILQVNISEIKSMWVGESEKNIKLVFDNYRAKVKECKRTPILLFNEADAIIGKRQEGAAKAVEKMENSIQNIILQEMETLDGILIATTNLAQNMDKAFERRFLYKIKFERPTVEARMGMWREMIPKLDAEQACVLATKYDFSGGQIENIARHYTIGNILHGDSEDLVAELASYCDSERLEAKPHRKIGFC